MYWLDVKAWMDEVQLKKNTWSLFIKQISVFFPERLETELFLSKANEHEITEAERGLKRICNDGIYSRDIKA